MFREIEDGGNPGDVGESGFFNLRRTWIFIK